MKQTIKVALLCTAIMLPLHAKKDKDSVLDSINQKVSRIRQIVTDINDKQKCTYEIHASDIGTTGYTITQPGTYCLVDDVIFNPSTPPSGSVVAAITIASSNVTLILGDHYLGQAGATNPQALPTYPATSPSTQTPYVVGILVPDVIPTNTDVNEIGLQSIYIEGDQAIIDGFSMYGIRIFGHTYDVRLSNLTVKNCGLLASHALRPFPNYFPHDSENAGYGPAMGVAGIAIGESDKFGMGPQFFTERNLQFQNRVSSVVIENVSCLNNFFNGIFMANTTDVTINNSHFDDTFSDDPGVGATASFPNYEALAPWGANFAGNDTPFEDPNLLNVSVSNTTFNNTAMRGDFTTSLNQQSVYSVFPGTGIAIAKSTNMYFERCQFCNGSNTFVGGTTMGWVNGGIKDVSCINCNFDGAKAITAAEGFHISGGAFAGFPSESSRNFQLINCTANNIQQIGDQQLPAPVVSTSNVPRVQGFHADFCKNLYLENCIAQDNVCNGPLSITSGGSAGFRINSGNDIAATEPNNTVLRGCVASRMRTVNGGDARGFMLLDLGTSTDLKTVLLEDCVAEGNLSLVPTLTQSPFNTVQGTGTGFAFIARTGNSFPVSYINCKSLGNKGVAGPSNAGTTLGIQYSAGFLSVGVLAGQPAQNHSYYQCEAIDNVYGFLLNNCSRFALRDCRANNNFLTTQGTTGEGFTDLGLSTTTTPTAVAATASLFEFNHAYNNGLGTDFIGTNQNYNVIVSGTAPIPTFRGKISTSSPYTFFDPVVVSSPVHNVSMIQ